MAVVRGRPRHPSLDGRRPLAGVGLRRGGGARSPPLARCRERRRRRLLPPRPGPEAPRVRRSLARRVDEFPDGGLHPGYAFPLWHGVPRARRQGVGRRSRRRRPPRPDRARAARSARGLRGGLGALPARRARGGRRRRGRRDRRDGPGARRRADRARPSGDRLPAAARPRGARARARGRAEAGAGAPRLGRRCLARARGRPSDIRALPLDPVRGFLAVRWLWERETRAKAASCSRRSSSRPGCSSRGSCPCRRHGLGRPRRGRARARLRAVRRAAERASRPVLGRARAVRPDRRRRGRGAARRPARGAGHTAQVGGVRRRRIARGLRRLSRPVDLHPVLRRGLALAVAAARGLPPARVRARRRDRRAGEAHGPRRRSRWRSPPGSSSSSPTPGTSATRSRTVGRRGRPGSRSSGRSPRSRSASAAARRSSRPPRSPLRSSCCRRMCTA